MMTTSNEKTICPFGLWKSKITPELIAAYTGLSDPQWDTDGKTLLWREGRSGQGVLMAQPLGEAPYALSGDLNVRAGVGYGGGDYTVRDGLAVFAAKDGRLYRRTLGTGFPSPITPEFGSAAAPKISPDQRWVAFVHTYEGGDVLAVVDAAGTRWPDKLAEGADFYMQPAWSPDGRGIAWVEWDHPNMPWDGTRLMYAALEGSPPRIKAAQHLAGGDDVPILQPAFSPDGRYLSYIRNEGEWDQLMLQDLESGELRVLVEDASLVEAGLDPGRGGTGLVSDERPDLLPAIASRGERLEPDRCGDGRGDACGIDTLYQLESAFRQP
jgi:Tol biopolymer transport system component